MPVSLASSSCCWNRSIYQILRFEVDKFEELFVHLDTANQIKHQKTGICNR